MTNYDNTLDGILMQIGKFGKYQKITTALLFLVIVFHSAVHLSFIFTTRDLNYRCEIPECDIPFVTEYNAPWLKDAVPYKNNRPSKCERYKVLSGTNENACTEEIFDKNVTEKCSIFQFETTVHTIQKDFYIFCEDKKWMLTLVGTASTFGMFIGLPISGILSDKFGRRTVMVWGLFLCSFFGIAKSFSPSYVCFMILEFLDIIIAAGVFSSAYILNVELVAPVKRALAASFIGYGFSIAQTYLGFMAWLIPSWRKLLLALYIPLLLVPIYFYIVSESIRWLLSKKKIGKAKDVLRKIAKVNKKELPEDILEKLDLLDQEDIDDKGSPFKNIFKSTKLIIRFVFCCYCWNTCTLIFYGLSFNSVTLAGNPYMDYILVSLIGIPAIFIASKSMDRFGRRKTCFTYYAICGISCLCILLTNPDSHFFNLIIYLVGTFGASGSFLIIYTITSEIFPTNLRHSLLATCSMVGRFGSMIAPQVPLLEQIWYPLPLVCFGSVGLLAALVALTFPETLNVKLPDTIEEAEEMGKI